MKDDDEKRRLRRQVRKTNAGFFPTAIVCTSGDLAEKPGAVELGALLALLTVLIYFYGFYQTVLSLPDTPRPPRFHRHMGENLNLARFSEWEDVAGVTADGASRKLSPTDPVAVKSVSSVGKVTVPDGKWPVSIRGEKDDFETIEHPAGIGKQMSVPKFWSPPIHKNKLMTREEAMAIGSCIKPGEDGKYNRGDACPLDQRTIYVGIASYRDFECRSTAESIFLRAKHPERIRIGVVDQINDGEDPVCNAPLIPCDEDPGQGLCKYKDQIDVYQMDAELSVGPVFARHIGYRMYRGEYYATQSDAHVTYTQDWDVDIISQMEITHNEMAVLSTYLTDVQGSIGKHGESLRKTRPIMCNTRYEGGAQGMHLRHGSQPERIPFVHGVSQLQPWWAAGYSFSRGHFVVNVPYDLLQPMIFQGEEMSIGIRGFTVGYDYYAPERSVCFHHYAVGKNSRIRNKVHHFWENSNQYAGTGKKAMQRLLGIVHMNPEVPPSEWDHTDEALYGLGGVRTPELFYDTFGIHVKEKKVEGHLCSFVDDNGNMHHKFSPFLRKDGMGIDYSKIQYRFKDPRPGRS